MVEKVTASDVEAQIVQEHYFTGDQAARLDVHACHDAIADEVGLMTFCILVLRGGFTVTATSWAKSFNRDDFIPSVGRDVARAKAIDQARPLLCYARRLGTPV
jgi:hypothetical protein